MTVMKIRMIPPISYQANSVETQRFLDLLRNKVNELQEEVLTLQQKILDLEDRLSD